jgi:phage terminase Nu1 subunit (DNA packaging protein)
VSDDTITPLRREPERFVDRAELARIMGVGQRTIATWVSEGMPSETWGLRARRFLPSECIAWAQRRGGKAA